MDFEIADDRLRTLLPFLNVLELQIGLSSSNIEIWHQDIPELAMYWKDGLITKVIILDLIDIDRVGIQAAAFKDDSNQNIRYWVHQTFGKVAFDSIESDLTNKLAVVLRTVRGWVEDDLVRIDSISKQ